MTVQSDRTLHSANRNVNTDGTFMFKQRVALDSENAQVSIDIESSPPDENLSTQSAHLFSKMQVKKKIHYN